MFALVFSNIFYCNLDAFYPLFMARVFPGAYNSVHFGVILGVYEIADLVVSLLIANYLHAMKRKRLILQNLTLLAATTVGFYLLGTYFTFSYALFVIGSLLLRVLQGAAAGIIQICAYSFATNEMRREKDKYIGYVEMALGIGNIVGPSIGTLLFSAVGYAWTFLSFGLMVFLGMLCSIFAIPNSLNKTYVYEEESMEETEEEVNTTAALISGNNNPQYTMYEELTYAKIFKHKECCVLLISCTFCVNFALYVYVIFAVEISDRFEISHYFIGLYFTLAGISYVISAPLAATLSEYMHRRYIILLAFVMMVVESACLGPSQLLGLSGNSLLTVLLGMMISGFCLGMGLVPLLSELITILEDFDMYEPAEIGEMTSGLFNSMFNIGNLIAPIIAGILKERFGYRGACDIMMVVAVFYTVFFFIVMVLPLTSKKKN